MKKYIIKNCPAFNDIPNMYGEVYGYCDNEHDIDLNKCMCENITDCVMKQIVEKCKEVNTKFYDSVHQRYLSPSKAKFAREIMNLLDIQEVE